jgi:hypothetical protein
MDRFLKTAELRDLESMLAKEEISYSKMVELINLKAQVWYTKHYKLVPLDNVKIPKTEGHSEDCSCGACRLIEKIFTIRKKAK